MAYLRYSVWLLECEEFIMFSIFVEEVFKISTRKGLILVGKTSGIIKIGDLLIDISDRTKRYKVIGIEMIHYSNKCKNSTHNPGIMIESNNIEFSELKGKVLELEGET